MKPDCFDDFNQDGLVKSPDTAVEGDLEAESIVGPWKTCNITSNPSHLKTIIELSESSSQRDKAVYVANNLFLYNSKAFIIEGPNNTKLVAMFV
jgi:hypothetical protein